MAGEEEGKPEASAAPSAAPARKRTPKSVSPVPVAPEPVPVIKAARLPAARGKVIKAPELKIASVPVDPAKPVTPRGKAATPKKIVPRSVAPTPAAAAVPKSASLQPKKIKAEIKTAPVKGKTPPRDTSPISQKDFFIMDMTSSYPSGFQDAFTEAQEKAKEAFEKGSSMLGEAGEFARGNVEAMVESGKILASGLQEMGASFAAESRSAFETISADLKELAAARTPADFLKLHSEVIRKSFDGAVAYGSKNSEAVLKLASDAFAPISGRVSLAVEKVRSAA
jgi:phasin family protein